MQYDFLREIVSICRIGIFYAFLTTTSGGNAMHYSDPTAAKGLSSINREFSRLEKKAKKLAALWVEGKLSPEYLAAAQSQFQGIYRHVLKFAIQEALKKRP